MEASARLLNSSSLNRHLLLYNNNRSLTLGIKLASRAHPPFYSRNPNPRNVGVPSSNPSSPQFAVLEATLTRRHRRPVPFSSASLPSSNPLASLLSLSVSQIFPSHLTQERLGSSVSDPEEGFHLWDRAGEGVDGGDLRFFGEKEAIWTVVLLGWLGAEQKHLKRYAEVYNSRGIRTVRFVVPVREFLGFDLGRRIEDRVAGLARELVSWCSETEKDGRERHLLFHTFSNTGWLSYGAILENLQSRSDVVEKIKGCVVDSGPSPEISPRVWAAGFGAALLKKQSSLIYSSVESTKGGRLNGNTNRLNTPDIRSSLSETIVLSILEKIFAIVLMLPDVYRRLSRIISTLTKNQPHCPQLYLYSSADKVIPVHSVEHFIQEQKALGRNVHSYDFGSSPHVDHFRSFPHIYSAKVDEFLKECCSRTVSR